MNLLAEMLHEGAGAHGNHVVGIELCARADPQGSFHHGDKAVVGVEVRPAIGARLVGVDNDV